jgi:predicted Zn-dependent peptidase
MGQARFYFEMGVSDENFPIATEGILADLEAFLKQPISEKDLETARKDEITRNRMTYQTNGGVAEGLGYWEAVGLGYEFFEEFPERIGGISARQVEKAAEKYLGVDRYQLVNVGTAKVE